MIFDLDKEEQGDWFEFFNSKTDQATGDVIYSEPEKDAAKFRIRSITPFWSDLRRGRKKTHQMVINPQTRAMERVSYIDITQEQDEKDNEAAWDYAITGIENAFDKKGKPIKPTLKNKMKLIKISSFLRFITRVFEIIDDEGVKQAKAAEKN